MLAKTWQAVALERSVREGDPAVVKFRFIYGEKSERSLSKRNDANLLDRDKKPLPDAVG